MQKRHFLSLLLAGSILLAVFITIGLFNRPQPPLRIGMLFSASGTMAGDEKPLMDAVRLAVEEINAAGGLLGRQVEMVVADGKSDDAVFAAEAERLITKEKVSALFACWTSSCRKAVKTVIEKHDHLMFYALQYEGLEQSPNIFYTGATANQQVIPGAHWAIHQFGKRVYLIGSDYIFPRIANLQIRDLLASESGTVLAEQYRPLGNDNFSEVIDDIRRLHPDVIFNTVNGSSIRAFFQAMHNAGIVDIPVMSFSVTETGLQDIGAAAFYPAHYATWNYFQSLPGEPNRQFVQQFRQRFGANRLTNDPVESIYIAARLWAQGVSDAQSDNPALVRRFLLQHSVAAPAGIAAVDRMTHHLWKPVYIGKARADFQFDVVWSSQQSLRPAPFPEYRTQYEWQAIIAREAKVVP